MHQLFSLGGFSAEQFDQLPVKQTNWIRKWTIQE